MACGATFWRAELVVKETVQSDDKAQEELVPKRSGWMSRLLRREEEERQHAAIPDGFRVYAVGDVHGRLDLLRNLWAMIEADAANTDLRKVVVFVGDYVDRGRDSKGVIDFLIEAKLDGGDIVCLRGNHDQAVLDFVADADFYRNWKPYGAPETLLSYGVMPPKFDDGAEFEKARREFVLKCPQRHTRFSGVAALQL